ncbi:MAG: zinc ribbon domain-containing protein [Candidatus Bathyarchaeia archaeon]
MPFCPSCGKEIPFESKYCYWCGFQIPPDIQKAKTDSIDICPKCGARMDRRSKLESDWGPWGFNPLGYALGLVKVREYYQCPKCKYQRNIQ